MSKLPLLLLAVLPMFGQLPSNTLTITATRSITVQPDQVSFELTVNSGMGTTLGQVVAALASLGVTSSDLSGVSTNLPSLQWTFNLAVPIANLTATINSLTNLENTITQNNSGLTLTFTVNGTQVSQQLLQSQQAQSCTNANLISDATTQAQKLASAAGMTLGPILKLSNSAAVQPTLAVAEISGTFAVLGAVPVPDFLLGYPASPVTCSLVVQFQLMP